jgi:hypothetical protein
MAESMGIVRVTHKGPNPSILGFWGVAILCFRENLSPVTWNLAGEETRGITIFTVVNISCRRARFSPRRDGPDK